MQVHDVPMYASSTRRDSSDVPSKPTTCPVQQQSSMDVHKTDRPVLRGERLHAAPKQHRTGPAGGQLPAAAERYCDSVYRPRARRLSEHGCGCCGLGLYLSSNPIAAPAYLAFSQDSDCITGTGPEAAATVQTPQHGMSELTAPAAAGTASSKVKFTSPFAGLSISIPDEQQLDQQQCQQQQRAHSTKHDSASFSDAAIAQALSGCKLVDTDGSPVPAFAIVSLSPWKPA